MPPPRPHQTDYEGKKTKLQMKTLKSTKQEAEKAEKKVKKTTMKTTKNMETTAEKMKTPTKTEKKRYCYKIEWMLLAAVVEEDDKPLVV